MGLIDEVLDEGQEGGEEVGAGHAFSVEAKEDLRLPRSPGLSRPPSSALSPKEPSSGFSPLAALFPLLAAFRGLVGGAVPLLVRIEPDRPLKPPAPVVFLPPRLLLEEVPCFKSFEIATIWELSSTVNL